jgi:hypothetical protein
MDAGAERTVGYVNVNAVWSASPRTRFGVLVRRDLDYSAFSTSGATPTNMQLTAEAYIDKMLSRTIYLRLFGRLGEFESDGEVTIETADGPVTAARSDRIREAGAELGYQFRSRVRIGVTATFSDRKSNFEDFGIEGLLAGLTIQYNPPQPSFR